VLIRRSFGDDTAGDAISGIAGGIALARAQRAVVAA